MNYQEKIEYFDYFISRIIYTMYRNNSDVTFYEIIKTNIDRCRLSKLKLLKLLFFVSAKKVNNYYLLDDIFDNYYAMPYGPVESDIYNHLNDVPHYVITNNDISLKVWPFEYDMMNIDENYSKINDSIEAVYEENKDLFWMNTFSLVDLSHKSEAWQMAFAEARKQGKFSIKMPNSIIKITKVYYR